MHPSSADKRTMLNLGCGTKTSGDPDVVNVDWSPYVRLHSNRILRAVAAPLLGPTRRERLARLPDNLLVHDLARGIPVPDSSVDVIYHSHFLEHLDRDQAPLFLGRVFRALRPSGIHRVVVPDLERLCRSYLSAIDGVEHGIADARDHDAHVAAIIEQSVRREAYATRGQGVMRRSLERLLLGDARRRGETHQWMYDRINLRELMQGAGFERVRVHRFDTSDIDGWARYGLDVDSDGNEYKPGSLYIEGRKPVAGP